MDFIIQGDFCIFAEMKPSFALIGKVDDPKSKSRGGPYILLMNRSLEEERKAIFNFDPDTVFYKRVKARQEEKLSILCHEMAFHFERRIK